MDDFDESIATKREVHRLLLSKIGMDADSLNDALKSIQLSANDETKSSAGDKYETGRAMAQLEIEKLGGLVQEKEKNLALVSNLSLENTSEIKPGALVKTSMGWFYVSVNGGEIKTAAGVVTCVSPASPLVIAMRGKMPGDVFRLMQNEHRIESIV